jgi:uncharacterized protein (TIGR00296 family)
VFKPYNLEQGAFLVKLARRAVEEFMKSRRIIKPPEDTPSRLLEDNYGVFTTIETVKENGTTELRGCIGFPRGNVNTARATINSALAAAFDDPRFAPLDVNELESVVFEVSVLSPLEEIKFNSPKELVNSIRVGVHGLVIERGMYSGLLLPQVPVEYCWDTVMFLDEACEKAYLRPECWAEKGTRVYTYEAQIFRERRPRGDVYERDLIEELKRCHLDEA